MQLSNAILHMNTSTSSKQTEPQATFCFYLLHCIIYSGSWHQWRCTGFTSQYCFIRRGFPWTAWPWRWRHCYLSKRPQLCTSQHGRTTKQTWIFSNAAVRHSHSHSHSRASERLKFDWSAANYIPPDWEVYVRMSSKRHSDILTATCFDTKGAVLRDSLYMYIYRQ